MLINDLIQIFIPIIKNGLTAAGYTGVSVVQSNQPTQQGVNSTPTVYFFNLSNKFYGYPEIIDTWDSVNNVMIQTQEQQIESTFQLSALVIQDPSIISYTAADLVKSVAMILQSYNTVQTLNNSEIGILKIREINNPYFVDDKDRFEAAPFLEFVLLYSIKNTFTDQTALPTEQGIYPI